MKGNTKNRIELNLTNEFSEIVRLIEESRNRAFQKVNEELVLLYFTVGKTVSVRVSEGIWGDKTVDELSAYILNRFPGLSGFTRRGLYRMKQFYETYSVDSFVLPLLSSAKLSNIKFNLSSFMSALPTQNMTTPKIVSAVPTQLELSEKQLLDKFLGKISWTNHMEILSQTKSPEERLFYLAGCIKEKWSMRELRRQLNSAVFERSLMANKIVASLPTQFPTGVFKDPYIFEFLDLPEAHSEKDFEKALTQNLRKFILEINYFQKTKLIKTCLK